MLNFITLKKDTRFEYRLYMENDQDIKGKVIYKGHKLGVSQDLLPQILEYKLERTTNKLYLLDYDNKDNWFITTKSNALLGFNKSYESLQTFAERQFGKFRKIVITII